jgi:hypothetical protein
MIIHAGNDFSIDKLDVTGVTTSGFDEVVNFVESGL